MNIQEFISNYHNHPVLFVGTGLSLRYLENSYSWDSLLKKVASEFNPDPKYYLDIKAEHMLSFQEVMKYNESSNKDELVEGILWRNYNG